VTVLTLETKYRRAVSPLRGFKYKQMLQSNCQRYCGALEGQQGPILKRQLWVGLDYERIDNKFNCNGH